MSIFKKHKKVVKEIPEECRDWNVEVDSSTGERLIGFREVGSRKLHYPEVANTEADIKAFYNMYGIPYNKKS